MDYNEAATACYELSALNPSYTAAIATFLLRFHSRTERLPPKTALQQPQSRTLGTYLGRASLALPTDMS